MTVRVVACGALALHVRAIARRRGLDLDVHALPPQLHNRPEQIAPAVSEKLAELRGRHDRIAVAYADCGSYGAVDALLQGTGIERLAGDTCYDLFSLDEVREALAEEPGTYFLTDFLVQLGSSAAPAICDLLGQVNHMKYRRALCESLAISCKNDVEVLIERLGDTRWYVIRNIVYVLGRIAHQGVERALDRALHHEDVRVRKEAVRALGNIESTSSRAYLVSAFRDTDLGVRMQAARTLAMKRDDRAAQSILGVIQGADFSKRDTNERQAFFEALGKTGSDALVPRLESILCRGGFFRSGNEEERLHAALALAWLGTPVALSVLNREMQSKREFVRKAVESALTSVRNAGRGSDVPADGMEAEA
jgi:hypothetical protein